MKRALYALTALAAAALAQGAAAEDVVLPSEVAQTHWKTDYQNDFAKLVDERSKGQLSVKVFPAGQLYNEQEALAALGTGAVQMVWPVSVRIESIAPATGVINLPFAITDDMMANDCFAKGITGVLSSHVEPRGLKILGLLRTADLFFIFKDDEITRMEDLKGKKVRVTGGRVFLDTMDKLGISPVSMAASEMSTAMSQGAIDGVFSSPAGWAEMIGISGKYAWYVPGFSLSTYSVVVDKGWFDGLSEENRAAITSSLEDISRREWVEAKKADERMIQKMTDQGAVFHTADAAEAARWKDLAKASAASFTQTPADIMKQIGALEQSCGVGG